MKIQLLCDNPKSWIVPYAKDLVAELRKLSHDTTLLFDNKLVERGDVLILLSCEKIFKELNLNTYNLVVHESNLPAGKGWSPLTWQILEGKNEIPVTLFEAAEKVDSGAIYLQEFIKLEGHELLQEIKHQQWLVTKKLIITFISKHSTIKAIEQKGEESFYPRRTNVDSKLDINKTLLDQFNLLRTVSNDSYPAYFEHLGHRYEIKIKKVEELKNN